MSGSNLPEISLCESRKWLNLQFILLNVRLFTVRTQKHPRHKPVSLRPPRLNGHRSDSHWPDSVKHQSGAIHIFNTVFQEAEYKGEEERGGEGGGEGGGMLSAHHSRFSVCSFSVYILFSAWHSLYDIQLSTTRLLLILLSWSQLSWNYLTCVAAAKRVHIAHSNTNSLPLSTGGDGVSFVYVWGSFGLKPGFNGKWLPSHVLVLWGR